jgi:hypothetical protein
MFFSGGTGISINVYFGNFFAISIVMGMLLYAAWRVPATFVKYKFLGRRSLPLILFASVLLSFVLSGYSNIWAQVAELADKQRRFDAEVSFLKDQPGPAICESLLRCYDAGKPYVYDPHSATRLVNLKKLSSAQMVGEIETSQYGTIQLHRTLPSLEGPNERFPNDVLDAIGHYYSLASQDQDCAIYVPKTSR